MDNPRTAAIRWARSSTPDHLARALGELRSEYPVYEGGDRGLPVRFTLDEQADGCSIRRSADGAEVIAPSLALALRAVGTLLAGLVEEEAELRERADFSQFGIMLDCSRNAVMKVEHIKRLLRRVSLLGYNMLMLYTEDTYQLPDEPYFGYLRGAYSAEEIREVDAYAERLGIEVIPCIQTLGHLAQILKFSAYREIADQPGVLMVDDPRTYELIDKMLDFWTENCRSRRIHVGMDETHGLGAGAFLKKHGYEDPFAIFNRHLGRVVEACRKRGLEPMIWGDMYFRLGASSGGYYDPETVIPQEAIDSVPEGVDIVYWDYYNLDQAFCENWIEKHREIATGRTLMGSGAWTWAKFWYDPFITEATAGPCIDACRTKGLTEFFVTIWGDDGAYCDFDSVLAGLAWIAERAHGDALDEGILAKRFAAVCNADYALVRKAGEIHRLDGESPLKVCSLMWDDPLLMLTARSSLAGTPGWLEQVERDAASVFTTLLGSEGEREAGRLGHARFVAEIIKTKAWMSRILLESYPNDDRDALREVQQEIPPLKESLRMLLLSFTEMWHERNKPFGLETVQGRFGWMIARYDELYQRLGGYLDGRLETLPELDEAIPQEALSSIPARWEASAQITSG